MPKVTTEISYAHEEFSKGEVSSFTREVQDLDIEDFLWYMIKISEMMGFDVKDINLISKSGKFYSTEE